MKKTVGKVKKPEKAKGKITFKLNISGHPEYAQMYIRMYEKYHDPVMIQPTIARVDSIVAKPSKARLWLGAKNWSERWSWCDALFMAPPVYGQLNKLYPEKNYLDFMDREFREATDSLYDADAGLYYRDRRYIPKKEKNGEKVFWGRGNGREPERIYVPEPAMRSIW